METWADAGVNRIWIPPATKGQSGGTVDYPYYVQFYQAELFLQLGLLEKAADAFEQVAQKGESKKAGREKKMALRAAEESVHAFERVWQEQLATKTSEEIVTKTEDAFAQSATRYLKLMGKQKDPQSVGIRYKVGKIAYDQKGQRCCAYIPYHPTCTLPCFHSEKHEPCFYRWVWQKTQAL